MTFCLQKMYSSCLQNPSFIFLVSLTGVCIRDGLQLYKLLKNLKILNGFFYLSQKRFYLLNLSSIVIESCRCGSRQLHLPYLQIIYPPMSSTFFNWIQNRLQYIFLLVTDKIYTIQRRCIRCIRCIQKSDLQNCKFVNND